MSSIENAKQQVHDFWNEQSCGESLYLDSVERDGYQRQLDERYRLEPFIPTFAEFDKWKNKRVLEIGVGLGADHQGFAQAGAVLDGIDLTERAVEHTKNRFDLLGLKSNLQVGDAEDLPFEDNQFDMVYSWGVLHHSPNTSIAIQEVYRVLKPGGVAKIMIYHKYSFVGYMLWVRYGLMKLRPFSSLSHIYANHLESPGTKAYSYKEAAQLLNGFVDLNIDSTLGHADLLDSDAGQRHRGIALTLARKIWPRGLIKMFFPKHGLFLFLSARKPGV